MATGTDTSTAAVQLLQMMTGYWVSQSVYVAAKPRHRRPSCDGASSL